MGSQRDYFSFVEEIRKLLDDYSKPIISPES